MAIFLTWRITRPIVRLVRTARRVSEGELDVPSPGVDDTDEFGELSRSFERMRSSVKAALTRLDE
jgi:HAMP domain-containing protein